MTMEKALLVVVLTLMVLAPQGKRRDSLVCMLLWPVARRMAAGLDGCMRGRVLTHTGYART